MLLVSLLAFQLFSKLDFLFIWKTTITRKNVFFHVVKASRCPMAFCERWGCSLRQEVQSNPHLHFCQPGNNFLCVFFSSQHLKWFFSSIRLCYAGREGNTEQACLHLEELGPLTVWAQDNWNQLTPAAQVLRWVFTRWQIKTREEVVVFVIASFFAVCVHVCVCWGGGGGGWKPQTFDPCRNPYTESDRRASRSRCW